MTGLRSRRPLRRYLVADLMKAGLWSADRGAFICQSQILNLFVAEPTIAKLSSMHFYAWKRGLKTGIYYLRTKPAVQAIKFTLDVAPGPQGEQECLLCSS